MSDFELDPEHFVAPRKCKISPHFEAGNHLNDHGDQVPKNDVSLPAGSVFSGGRFESVTIGKMPGRQIIVYDKSLAAKVQQTPYWFKAWGLDPDDKAYTVWRVEIRAGRDSWRGVKGPLGRRSYETIEALLQRFLMGALRDIRYVTNRGEVSNVTRAGMHPLWHAAQGAVANLPVHPEPPLTPDYVVQLLRKLRRDMAMAQAFGNLNNLLVLEGLLPCEIQRHYPTLAGERAGVYIEQLGRATHARKLNDTAIRQSVFLQSVNNKCS